MDTPNDTVAPLAPLPTTAAIWRTLVAPSLTLVLLVSTALTLTHIPRQPAPLTRAALTADITSFVEAEVAATARPFTATYTVSGSALVLHFTGTDVVSYAPQDPANPTPPTMTSAGETGTYGYKVTTDGGHVIQWIVNGAGVTSCVGVASTGPAPAPLCVAAKGFPRDAKAYVMSLALIPSSSTLTDVKDVARATPPAQFVTRHSDVFGALECLRVTSNSSTTEWCQNGQHFPVLAAVWGPNGFHTGIYATAFTNTPDSSVLSPIGTPTTGILPTPLA